MIDHKPQNQTIISISAQNELISRWAEAFLVSRKAENLSAHTVKFYRVELSTFLDYCTAQVIDQVDQITPDVIRRYLLYLEEQHGRNPGGVHAAYRTVRAFLLWFEDEAEPAGWRNPIRKVKAPKVPNKRIEPVELDAVRRLLKTCQGSSFTDTRDKALLLFLLDTGARAAEVCALDLADVDQITGAVLIREGKGRKPRTVFLGQKARKALRAYLKQRRDSCAALWVTDDFTRLTYWGLNQIIRRRAKIAGVPKPGLHDFRRAFALNFLRNGGDIYTLQMLMGHADLQVLRRYLAQNDEDAQAGHAKAGPVDHADL